MARKEFFSIDDYPDKSDFPLYAATISNGILIDVSIAVDAEEVKSSPEGSEEDSKPDIVGWNATIESVGCAQRPTLENAMKQFGYAAERLDLELDKNKVEAALHQALDGR